MKERGRLQIAIDGPAGAGKSTVAKEVAKRLGLLYLDTGAMYRVIAYKALRQGITLAAEKEISDLAENTTIEISAEQQVWCDGTEVSQAIRSPEVSRAVSVIAAYPQVRRRLVEMQQAEAQKSGIVMDGRDIGTHVLPHANIKIFLTASPEERARRRWLELKNSGKNADLFEVAKDLAERDKRDAERATAPLEAAADAFILDTTTLSVNEIVTRIISLAQEDGR